MAKYEVTSPDGTKYEITAPDDATEQQVISYAQQQFGKQQPAMKGDMLSAPERFAYGMQEPITGLAQMAYESAPESIQRAGTNIDKWLYEQTGGILGKKTAFPEAVRQQERAYQAGAPDGTDLARLAGNVATGVLATRGIGAPSTLAGNIAQGAGVGAGLGAAAPVYQPGDYWQQKGGQVGGGALAGGLLGPVGYGMGRMIAPQVNPDIQMLQQKGVTPSIGATLGGAANRLEQMSMSIPFFGDAVANARRLPIDQFNKTVLNEVVAPVGKTVNSIGHEGIQEVQKISQQAYKAAENMLPGFRMDNMAAQEISNLVNMAKNLKPNEATRFIRFMKNDFNTRFKGGGITSSAYKRLDSEIGKAATGNQGTELGNAFKELDSILKRQAERISPEYKQAISNADEVFVKRVIAENAVNRATSKSGVFTPNQLSFAARATDPTKRKATSAAGRRPFQDLAQAAERVIGNTYPESGTAGRWATMGLIPGAAIEPASTAAIAGGLWGGGQALYNPTMQNLLRSAATQRPPFAQPIAEQVTKAMPLLSLPFMNMQ